ncbi:MAG: hypothetical protein WCS88_03500 [Patescibacteria group bacterium]|jgi:hypothetical protein
MEELMSNKNKLLFIVIIEFFLGFIFWPAFCLALFFFVVYLSVDTNKKNIAEENDKKLSCCPNCQSRHYLVFPQRSKLRLHKLSFVSHKVTLFECLDCEAKWYTYEVDHYAE